MPIKAIDAFRISESKNDPLAMCNLGHKLLNGGFYREAKEEADKALAIKPEHKNVPELLKRLNDIGDQEASKLTETLSNVKEKAAFYRKLGEAVLKPTPADVAAKWNSPDGVLEAKFQGTSLRIFGTHQRPENSLGSFLVGGSGSSITVTHRIEYSCQIRGDAIFCQVKRSKDGHTPSVWDSANEDIKALMVLNEDRSEISVMERPESRQVHFYSLTRAPRKVPWSASISIGLLIITNAESAIINYC